MMLLRRMAVVLVSSCLLISCAHHLPSNVTVVNDQVLRFSGKGSSAGVMLSSTMGAMGVAIGFAIDEGIAKDIRVAADKAQVDIDALLVKRFSNQKMTHKFDRVTVHVNRYGFLSWPTGQDGVVPQLHISVETPAAQAVVIRYPEDFFARNSAHNEAVKVSDELARIKKEGQVIQRLFVQAVDAVAVRFESTMPSH